MNQLFALLILATLIEGTITYIREMPKELHWSFIWALGLGLLLSFGYNIDLPNILGGLLGMEIQSTIPYLGQVLAGIAMARGSNYIFDTIGWISTLKDKLTLPTVNDLEE